VILALDTATRVISIALHDDREVIAEQTWRTAEHHTVELAAAVRDLLSRVGIAPRDLWAVAVALGPGSYTGLRIGLALAKGLILATTPPRPLIGVPTLDITAAAQVHVWGRLCAVSQAGRGRINAAFYDWRDDHWHIDDSPFTVAWPDLAARIDRPTQIAGEISPAGIEALSALGDLVRIASGAESLRRAGFLAEIACCRLAEGLSDDPATLAPIYLT
jgi:tRNA threonylcarbamoyladenosine biosynthesis protein TsaB